MWRAGVSMSPRSLARDGDRVLASVPAISSSTRLYSLTSANTEQRFERAASGRGRPAEADLQLGASLLGEYQLDDGRHQKGGDQTDKLERFLQMAQVWAVIARSHRRAGPSPRGAW